MVAKLGPGRAGLRSLPVKMSEPRCSRVRGQREPSCLLCGTPSRHSLHSALCPRRRVRKRQAAGRSVEGTGGRRKRAEVCRASASASRPSQRQISISSKAWNWNRENLPPQWRDSEQSAASVALTLRRHSPAGRPANLRNLPRLLMMARQYRERGTAAQVGRNPRLLSLPPGPLPLATGPEERQWARVPPNHAEVLRPLRIIAARKPGRPH